MGQQERRLGGVTAPEPQRSRRVRDRRGEGFREPRHPEGLKLGVTLGERNIHEGLWIHCVVSGVTRRAKARPQEWILCLANR